MTGNVSNAIASLAKAWSGKNMTIGQADVGSVLVPVVIYFALPLVVIGGFVSLAATGHATNIIPGLWASAWST
jgi:hypothetical protein